MIDQRTTGIEPPPSLDDILSHSDRIGRVDFNHRLVPEPAPEPEPERIEPADEDTADEDTVDEDTAAAGVPVEEPVALHATTVEEAPAEGAEVPADPADPTDVADAAAQEPATLPTILPVVRDLADEVEPVPVPEPELLAVADHDDTETEPGTEPGTVVPAGDELHLDPHQDPYLDEVHDVHRYHHDQGHHDQGHHDQGHHDRGHDDPYDDVQEDEEVADVLELSEPTSALLSLVPAEDAAVVAEDVDDVVAGVIGRIREVRSATIAHLEAIEVESALRCEMLTAQAELDAELIRLHARREAHAIIAAARHRSGLPPRTSSDEQRLRELHDAATRLSEELEALGIRRGSPDHPFSR